MRSVTGGQRPPHRSETRVAYSSLVLFLTFTLARTKPPRITRSAPCFSCDIDDAGFIELQDALPASCAKLAEVLTLAAHFGRQVKTTTCNS